MSHRPARITQAEIERAIRAAKKAGLTEVEVRLGDRIGANYMSGARSSNKGARTGRAMSAATEIAKGTA